MNKSDLVAAIAAKTGATKKDAEASLNAFTEVVTEALVKGDKIQLVGFGSFEVRKRAARKPRRRYCGSERLHTAHALRFLQGRSLRP